MVLGILNKSDFTDDIRQKLKVSPNLGYLKPKTQKFNLQYNAFLEESSFELYKETKNYALIPFYFLDNINLEKLYNKTPVELKKTLSCNPIKLRDGDQLNCYNKVIHKCENACEFSGIINLSTSAGKTVLSLAIIDKLGFKSLILVNKLELLQQWKERISQFLPLAKVGIIQGNKFEVDNIDITIGMVQTISTNKNIKMNDLMSFGVCIIDEVHSISTKTFGQVFFKITSPFQFGLSATLERSDNLDIVYRSFLGSVIYSNVIVNKKQESIVNVYNCNFDLGTLKPTIKLFGEERPNLAGILNSISMCHSRNEFILQTICNVIQDDSNRKILCMSDRISQLKWLAEKIPESGLFIGKMSSNELKECRKNKVILATYQMVIQGFDQPDINTLVFLTPRSNIEQAIGRIYRQEHKIKPMIIDFKDTNFQILINQSKKRIKLYKSKINNVSIKTNGT